VSKTKPALQYSQGRSLPWSGAKVVNCFAEKADGDREDDLAIMATPGLDRFAVLGSDPVRGSTFMGDKIYAVAGTSLYSIDQNGSVSLLGSVPGLGPVKMANNGTEVAIAADPNGYVYSGGTVHSSEDLPEVIDVAYIDSYFVWVIRNSDQCIYSGIADGLSYDLLDVFTAEGSPDRLIGIVNDHRELQLYGGATIEVFYNAGGADNVFERQGNAFIERGCFDRDSIVKIDNSVHFVGDDRTVYRLDGYTPIRISTHAIEYQLRNATYMRAFTYAQEGHKFYCISTGQGTFCYDMATGAWHERKSWQTINWRVGGAVTAWNRTILSDAYTGILYTPNLDSHTEDGDPIAMEVELPQIGAGRSRVTMYGFEVYCETGVGLNDGQGSDPKIMLRYSDDGGRTWSNELWRSLGRIGQYRTRAIWRTLGQFRVRTMRLTITDPVRRLIMSYYADCR